MRVEYPGSPDHILHFASLPRAVKRRAKAMRPKSPPTPFAKIIWADVVLLFGSVLMLFIGGVHLLIHRVLFGVAPILISALFMWAIVAQLTPGARRKKLLKKWEESKDALAPTTVEIDDAGFHFIDKHIERHVDWLAVRLIYESDTHIIVEDRQPLSYIIPKGAFTSPQDHVVFCDFIRAKIAAQQPTAA